MTPEQVYLTDSSFESALKRFLPKIRIDEDCWMWTGATVLGYAAFQLGKWDKPIETRGNRASYRMFKGDIPAGMVVMHSCDRPGCVNPSHLTLGTQKENLADATRKGRATRGSQSHHAKVSESDVLEIRRRRSLGETLKAIGSDYGLSEAAVCMISRGKKWKHVHSMQPISGHLTEHG